MELNTKRTIGELIRMLRDIYLREGENAFYISEDWYIYTLGTDGEYRLDTPCCIADRPDYDDEKELEIFPAFAVENNMYGELMPEMLEDVIASALSQKPDATEEDLLKALNYYADTDAFLQF